MFILIKGNSGKEYVVKKSLIKRVISSVDGDKVTSIVSFTNKANGSIIISGTPGEFYKQYLEK